jgi:ferredoxin
MTYIIVEPCVNVKDAACVDVCPVDCIHPTKNETEEFEKETMLYIDPEECIDCGACEPVCPVEAIFEETATPEKWKNYTQINADWYKNKKA